MNVKIPVHPLPDFPLLEDGNPLSRDLDRYS